jgi:hypothetical protein
VVRQLEAQVRQGGQDPVAEDQLVVGPGASGTLTRVAAALPECALVGGGPRVGELGDELAQVLPGDAGEDRMLKGRSGPCWSSVPS